MTEVGEAKELLLVTDDYSRAKQHVTDIYIPHELTAHAAAPLDFRIRYLESDRFTLGHLRYGADSELIVPPMEHCYHVNLTLHGRTTVEQRGTSMVTVGGSSGVVLTPHDSFTVRWSPDAIQYAIKIPRWSLERQLESLIGRPLNSVIDFELGFSLDGSIAQGMIAAITHMRDELSRPGGAARYPLVRAQLENYVMSQMLSVMRHEYSEQLVDPGDRPGSLGLARARDFIHEHAAEPITVADIARASFMSVRALQTLFRDELGLSPMQYVSTVRLDFVLNDLLNADGSVQVQQVALRWGFAHLGRFANLFRERYGVLPSSFL